MFTIASPQTVTLASSRENFKDAPPLAITFHVDGANAARCIMDVTLPNGDVHSLVFNTRGQVVEQGVVLADDVRTSTAFPSDYIVDGRDIRADNPYTHIAPLTVDSAYLPPGAGQTVAPLTDEQRANMDAAAKLRDEAMANAAEAARKAQDERAKLAAEKPEDRIKRLEDERQERLQAALGKPRPNVVGDQFASHDHPPPLRTAPIDRPDPANPVF